jgi:pyruvate dehydrogenase E2 component (dihydrolipoamide acetyltransferase)
MGDFTMPSLGADMDSGTLVEWLVHPGDRVHRGDPMAVVDTDKSAIEVESFDDGVVDALLVQPGQRVAVGTTLATLSQPTVPTVTAAAAEPPVPTAAEPPVPTAAAPARPGRVEVGTRPPRRVSPYARRLAHELGVDLDQVTGSGSHGLIRSGDVRAAVVSAGRSTAPAAVPTPAPAAVEPEPARTAGEPVPEPAAARAAGPTPKAGTRATVAALMARSKREIPHYYVATTVDLHALTEWLRRTNRERSVPERIVPAAALLKAAALAAREIPELNGFWRDGGFVPGPGVHLGVAVSVRDGALVAPAVHDAADLALPDLMAALRDLVARARSGRLRRAELADPTLTVTDLGDQGVEEVIGVIQPPQVALVGVGRIVERPWAVDGLLGVRPVVRLTLSGDHRATDGTTGARFLRTMERLLQQPEEL